MQTDNIKKGFTLAEVLITLGIIGVIAAVTIPTLINNYHEKQTVGILKEVYSILSQTSMQIMADNGGSLVGVFPSGSNDAATIATVKIFEQYLNPITSCYGPANTFGTCFPTFVSRYADSDYSEVGHYCNSSGHASGMILPNGASLAFCTQFAGNTEFGLSGDINSTNCTGQSGATTNTCLGVAVDVNGLKEPNKAGKDVFEFVFTPKGITSRWDNGAGGTSCAKGSADLAVGANSRSGEDCAAQIMRDGWQITYW